MFKLMFFLHLISTFLLFSLISLPRGMSSSRINFFFRKSFPKWPHFFASSSSDSPLDSSSSSSFSSSSSSSSIFDQLGQNDLDLIKQKRHIGDIQQLWDEDEMNGKMRNALKPTSSNRWTQIRSHDGKFVIPFIISGQFTMEERQKIQKAMAAIANNSCVEFRPRKFNEFDYVDIQNRKDEGCYTQVGRVRGRQVLMLESGWSKPCGSGCIQTFPGCVKHATIVHELLHKVGLWHEHMRFDRDDHIKVHFENIPPDFHAQFRKIGQYESTTYNVPYDYLSVMHYGKESGARRNGLTTMETMDKRYQNLIGTVKDASPSDYRKICAIYKCTKCMGREFNATSANWESTSAGKKRKENEDNSKNSREKKRRRMPWPPRGNDRRKKSKANCEESDFLRPSKMFCSLIDANELPNLYKFLCC